MKTYKVLLNSITDVKAFVSAATAMPCDVDATSGRYIIDVKSILGMFSLDLSKPVMIELHGTDEDAAKFEGMISKYIVE